METTITMFDDLPDQLQTDLTDWYNRAELDDDDKRIPTDLYARGRFHAWNCPTCGERVQKGDPEEWGDFQGVCQPDYTSYPGDADVYTADHILRQCDSCRMSSCGPVGAGEGLPAEY